MIQLILDRVFRCKNTEPLDILEEHLCTLLDIYTKETPFTCPRENLYSQTDGVAMDKPLGVLFANFFTGSIEKTTLQDRRASVYERCVDDISIRVNYIEKLPDLK